MFALVSMLLAQPAPQVIEPQRVTFTSQGQTLVGHLYLPADASEGQTRPAVVVTGAWTTVKEQMPAIYARALAAEGFVALTFDFRGWGESADDARYLEDPVRKTQDIQAAAAFLAQHPAVAEVAGLGICASAGYMTDAAHRSPHIQAVALVAPWLHDAAIVDAVYGGVEGVDNLIAVGRTAQAKFEQTGELTTITAASETDSTALMQQAPYYTDSKRGMIAAYDNQFNLASWEPWLTYDALQTADRLRKPLLMVHSEVAAIPQGARQFAQRMGEGAELVMLDDVTQFDFYDQPDAVRNAVAHVVRHLNANLK